MNKRTITLIFSALFVLIISCQSKTETPFEPKKSEMEIRQTLERLLTSIENRDLESLKSTMSPSGKMELVLPATETTYSVDEFVNMHQEWFKDSLWTIKTKILNIEAGKYIGTATTEAIYKEPERDGVPYFNHLIVTYALENREGNWYVIKDHASSLKKSTD